MRTNCQKFSQPDYAAPTGARDSNWFDYYKDTAPTALEALHWLSKEQSASPVRGEISVENDTKTIKAPLGAVSSAICPSKTAMRQCQNRRQSPRHAGFTLIEVMISVAIFSMVVAAIYSTWFLILNGTRTAQVAAAQVQRQRITIHSIEESLTTIQSFQASPQYYSFVVSNGDSSSLSFTSRLPDDFPGSGRYSGYSVRRLIFSVEPPPNPANTSVENTGEKDLVLRQYPILTGMSSDEQADPLVLARNVQTFSVECWDTNAMDWVDEWDTTNSIPPLIRVDLVLGRNTDNFGSSTPTFSVSRLISPPSEMMPTIVQVPSGVNNGLNPGGPGIKVGTAPGGGRQITLP